MSAVIKSGEQGNGALVMAFSANDETPLVEQRSIDPRHAEIERLRALLVERDAAIDAAKAELGSARAEGEAAGRLSAKQAADVSRADALALLGKSLAQAREDLAAERKCMEILALTIARTALEKMFGQDAGPRSAIEGLVRHQLRLIERQLLIRIEVSPADFPEPDELNSLAAEMGVEQALLTTDADLAPGACRMKLRLGTMDLGVDQQWSAVRGLLDKIAADAPAQR